MSSWTLPASCLRGWPYDSKWPILAKNGQNLKKAYYRHCGERGQIRKTPKNTNRDSWLATVRHLKSRIGGRFFVILTHLNVGFDTPHRCWPAVSVHVFWGTPKSTNSKWPPRGQNDTQGSDMSISQGNLVLEMTLHGWYLTFVPKTPKWPILTKNSGFWPLFDQK